MNGGTTTKTSTGCYEFRQVRLGAVPVFSSFIKSFFSSLFLFLSSFREFSKRFPGFGKGDSRCSSCYPCTALKGWHHLTHTVTARKRAYPISKTGRCQPRLSNGRATFQNLSSFRRTIISFLLRKLQNQAPTISQPKSAGWTLPVRQRQRSTAI